ncbi:MAG: 16S rRNA (cytosine(1402)-N(4))-methyltransferase [SAR116 cluster bacterium]|nr:16S rRNA (cytosine(1402)-N(4))-methyltransferase [SAR116 cluster bacterium]
MNKELRHIPVLLNETIQNLNLIDNGTYVDATLGMGGYTERILSLSNCKLVSIDRDPLAIENATELKKRFGERLHVVNGLFSNLDQILKKLSIPKINGITFDFGVSSPQIDDPTRGFSFRYNSALDMRMGRNEFSATDFINDSDADLIEKILREYGEEKQARRLSKAIFNSKPIQTTKELSQIVYSILGNPKKDKIDPATRTFQAIRIAVNNELEEIRLGLATAIKYLAPKGRILAVSFHSLEDRIVKRFFTENSSLKRNINRHLPPSENEVPKLKVVTKKPILPKDREINDNPRSRSAKLRVAEKVTSLLQSDSRAA